MNAIDAQVQQQARLCQCTLSGDIHVVRIGEHCELCDLDQCEVFNPENVAKAFKFLAERPSRVSNRQGLTYVDSHPDRRALTLTFDAHRTEKDIFDRWNEPVTWEGDYKLTVNPTDGGIYRIYLTRNDWRKRITSILMRITDEQVPLMSSDRLRSLHAECGQLLKDLNGA